MKVAKDNDEGKMMKKGEKYKERKSTRIQKKDDDDMIVLI